MRCVFKTAYRGCDWLNFLFCVAEMTIWGYQEKPFGLTFVGFENKNAVWSPKLCFCPSPTSWELISDFPDWRRRSALLLKIIQAVCAAPYLPRAQVQLRQFRPITKCSTSGWNHVKISRTQPHSAPPVSHSILLAFVCHDYPELQNFLAALNNSQYRKAWIGRGGQLEVSAELWKQMWPGKLRRSGFSIQKGRLATGHQTPAPGPNPAGILMTSFALNESKLQDGGAYDVVCVCILTHTHA